MARALGHGRTRRRRARRTRSVAMAALASALTAVLAASGGCEVMVGRDVPAFACDEGPDVCPDNEVCDVSAHQCVVRCELIGCKDGLTCDPTTHLCTSDAVSSDGGGDVTRVDSSDGSSGIDADASMRDQEGSTADTGNGDSGGCRTFGCACGLDTDCDQGEVCVTQQAAPDVYSSAGHAFCSKPCCTSADCDQGTVCFGPGQGGNYCVRPSWLPDRSMNPGSGQGGAACSGADPGSQCRSGLCVGGSCADTCCSTKDARSECAGGATCEFSSFPGSGFDRHYVANCGPAPGSGSSGSSCSGRGSCVSGLCLFDFDWTCHDACRSENDCASGQECTIELIDQSTPADIASICWPPYGNGAEGSQCTQGSDCRSGLCNGTVCTTTCFSDADCAAPVAHCRLTPLAVQGGGTYSVLLCGN
jgi:hypothetical protein